MKKTTFLAIFLVILILAAALPLLFSYAQNNNSRKDPVYVGVAFAGNSTTQAEMLIDKVKDYTNLFILDSGINAISLNETASREVCDYAVNAGLNIIINMGSWTPNNWPWQIQFLNQSRILYGDKFLGCYYDDEPGGIPMDWNWTQFFSQNSSLLFGNSRFSLKQIYSNLQLANSTGIRPQNYDLEAIWFNYLLTTNRGHSSLNAYNISTFTSDYVLYWYDYLGGYDTLFAQLGWNISVTQQIALIRGAATMQNKDWGAIITWKYLQPPYLDTPENIYSQMVTAYNGGAKYITIFDYAYNTTGDGYSGMTDADFQVLENFLNQVVAKQTPPTSPHAAAALVLPHNYGWGMRNPDDRIWGFWGPDDKSPQIWNDTQILLGRYGIGLDIIYDDPAYPVQGNYSRVYYWNQTL